MSRSVSERKISRLVISNYQALGGFFIGANL